MSSEEYLARIRTKRDGSTSSSGSGSSSGNGESPSMVLVDARSAAEMEVSIIPGAVPLCEFEHDIVRTLRQSVVVVVYCTIGYRSGMEARRLGETYGLRGRVRNLDGIVSYTFAVGDSSDESMHLVKPDTGERTSAVHTFGPTWNCVHPNFETFHFNAPELALRSAAVGLVSALRFTQHLHYKTRQCCDCTGNGSGKQSTQVVTCRN